MPADAAKRHKILPDTVGNAVNAVRHLNTQHIQLVPVGHMRQVAKLILSFAFLCRYPAGRVYEDNGKDGVIIDHERDIRPPYIFNYRRHDAGQVRHTFRML